MIKFVLPRYTAIPGNPRLLIRHWAGHRRLDMLKLVSMYVVLLLLYYSITIVVLLLYYYIILDYCVQ